MGVTKANVYYYFRTKIAILEALLAPTVAALTARLDDAERITREERVDHLDDFAQRGLHLMFGPAPTVDEQAAYWLISDQEERVDHLSDDELRATLVRLCRGVVREAGRARSTNTR